MQEIFNPEVFNTVLSVMAVSAIVVFLCLLKVEAGYGVAYTKKWGPAVNNKLGWILMEAPVFFAMLWLWLSSDRRCDIVLVVMTLLFLFHYFQRSFVFPFLIKGKSVMPLSVILMGVTFNTLNAYMIGGWLFYVSPVDYYGSISWFGTPMFIVGCVIFFAGMAINWHSDYIIRHLRKPGDTGHYIPRGGMFRYVTSANYFGEFLEWCGFALLTFSAAGVVFALWTFANLAPRARKLHQRYEREFGDEYKKLNRKYILPYIY